MLIKKYNIYPYNNPFISTLIPNDTDYIKLINNIYDYIQIEPVLDMPSENSTFCIQNNGKWYKHDAIQTPYPVIYLNDIEIHCIHDDFNNCLDKFKRRLSRMKELVLSKHNMYLLLSYSEFINHHDDTKTIIDLFFKSQPSQPNINKIFLGPNKYKIDYDNDNYIGVKEWDNISLERNDSHVLLFNKQPFNECMFYNKINEIIMKL
jgi:hypothetical protein